MDISQSDIIIGFLKRRLSFAQNITRFSGFALLKLEPALQHAHYRGHLDVAQLHCQISSTHGVSQRVVILPFFSQTAALPETNNSQGLSVIQFICEASDEIEMADRGVGGFLRHGDHALCHAEVEVISKRKLGAQSSVKTRKNFPQQVWTGKSNVDPLCPMRDKASSVQLP